ncbi:MAG: hypothetical protein JWO30_2997 [Fibrobacteres bacterium]|nr:hypothetical protein [Fibrobacterota bacterium]
MRIINVNFQWSVSEVIHLTDILYKKPTGFED